MNLRFEICDFNRVQNHTHRTKTGPITEIEISEIVHTWLNEMSLQFQKMSLRFGISIFEDKIQLTHSVLVSFVF
jgi:hypothetical protein